MQNGGKPPHKPPVARVAVWSGNTRTGLRHLPRTHHRTPRSPVVSSTVQHLLFAGPISGALSVVYGFILSQGSPAEPVPASGQVIRHAPIWQGHVHVFYITAVQQALWWAMAFIGLAWLVGVVATLIVLGIRRHRREGAAIHPLLSHKEPHP